MQQSLTAFRVAGYCWRYMTWGARRSVPFAVPLEAEPVPYLAAGDRVDAEGGRHLCGLERATKQFQVVDEVEEIAHEDDKRHKVLVIVCVMLALSAFFVHHHCVPRNRNARSLSAMAWSEGI